MVEEGSGCDAYEGGAQTPVLSANFPPQLLCGGALDRCVAPTTGGDGCGTANGQLNSTTPAETPTLNPLHKTALPSLPQKNLMKNRQKCETKSPEKLLTAPTFRHKKEIYSVIFCEFENRKIMGISEHMVHKKMFSATQK